MSSIGGVKQALHRKGSPPWAGRRQMIEIVEIETVFDDTFTRQLGFPKERHATKLKRSRIREFRQNETRF